MWQRAAWLVALALFIGCRAPTPKVPLPPGLTRQQAAALTAQLQPAAAIPPQAVVLPPQPHQLFIATVGTNLLFRWLSDGQKRNLDWTTDLPRPGQPMTWHSIRAWPTVTNQPWEQFTLPKPNLPRAFFRAEIVSGFANVGLAWDPSPSTNVLGYRIYFGPASRTYTNALDVGNALTATVNALARGSTYFFAATAYSTNAESEFSDEVCYLVP